MKTTLKNAQVAISAVTFAVTLAAALLLPASALVGAAFLVLAALEHEWSRWIFRWPLALRQQLANNTQPGVSRQPKD